MCVHMCICMWHICICMRSYACLTLFPCLYVGTDLCVYMLYVHIHVANMLMHVASTCMFKCTCVCCIHMCVRDMEMCVCGLHVCESIWV